MKTINRFDFSTLPMKFSNLGDGNWYYHYDITPKEVIVPIFDETESERAETWYSAIQIKMTGTPDYKRCVEAVIREYLTQSQEFDLINSYNRAMLDQLSEEEAGKARTEYIGYLDLLSEIKAKVRADFDALLPAGN